VSIETTVEHHTDKRATIRYVGRLDAVSALDVKSQLKELVDEGYVELIVSLEEVPFVDSSGLACLVSGLKATRQAGGTLKLAGLCDQARTVFRLTMLERVFEIYDDPEQAQASFPDQAPGAAGVPSG
jgi:anti-sigma B factor antagonist